MTALNITFSQTLVGNNGQYVQPGVWVDAVYFTDSGGTANWTQLIANGVLQSGNLSITLPEVYSGGKVYLLVWSGTPTSTDPFQGSTGSNGFVTQESDISIANAETDNYRFDSVELTINGSGANAVNDVANLTSVVGFGLPMQLNNTLGGSVGYNISGESIFNSIQAINSTSNSLVFPFVGGPLGTGSAVDRYGTAPASASQLTVPPFPTGTTAPFTSNDWVNYVSQFQSTSTLNQPTLYMAGFFNGAPDANGIWHNQGFYNFSLSYDGTNFWLSPAANSQIQGYIQISPSQLENSIYATNANIYIYTNKGDATPYTIYDPNTTTQSDTMNVGANNQWGDVLKELFTGFSAGFWGATAPSLNSSVSASVDLTRNWNWDPTYAFGRNGTSNTTNFDAYSKVFFANSNSYGSGYSDNLMALYRTGGPLLSVFDPSTQADVAQLNLTIYADGDTPGGYTQPLIYNYLAPPVGGYVAPPASSVGNALSITLDFSAAAGAAGETTYLLDQGDAQVTLQILTGITAGTPTWTPIQFLASAAGANGSLWWNWSVSSNGMGGYTATPQAGTAQDPGSLVISGMPVNTTAGSGITWYQIVVSALDGTASKTFNLYATTVLDQGTVPGAVVATSTASSISNGTLTIGGTIGGAIFGAGMFITGPGIPDGTMIIGGVAGSGTYTINNPTLSISSEQINGIAPSTVATSTASSISGTTLTVGGTIGLGNHFGPGVVISDGGVNIPNGTYIVSNGTGTGGAGTYIISTSLNVSSEAISALAPLTLVSPNGYAFTAQPTAQQVDGGAIIGLTAPTAPFVSDTSFTVAFQNGVFTSIDPSLLVMGAQPSVGGSTIPMLGTPSSPVAGTLSGGVFSILQATTLSSPDNISATTTSPAVSIGWVGLSPGAPVNPTYNTNGSYNAGWITSYTNKISPLDYAVVLVTSSTGTVVNGAVTQGDIDGQWFTPAITLTPGTYTVTMQEFPGPAGFQNFDPVSNVSSSLSLTITTAPVGIAPNGTHIDAVATGPLDPAVKSGVWIDLALLTSSASLPQGAAVLLYGTAADGSLVGRDGHTGPGVTLADAVLAKIGPTQSDNGQDLMVPLQSVFLPVTEQMHFAVLNKDGSVSTSQPVTVGGLAGGILDVSIAGVHLQAKAGNDLADQANVATLQRAQDLPLLFLAHGAHVVVEVAGSAANTNTVGFVRMELDSAGHLSVDGVAYGATQAFTNAVLANLDPGFSTADGGRTFDRSESWIVAGQTGYYAPVMLSQNGDVFVIGTANSDGREHIRLLGENIFGVEDLTAGRHSDFDYNDMLIGVRLETLIGKE